MAQEILKDTATNVIMGPFVNDTDGVSAVTFVATDADYCVLWKQGSTNMYDISGYTFTQCSDATLMYECAVPASDVDTLGPITISVADASLCLPVVWRGNVIEKFTGAMASDVAALNNLAASDIQAELVTYAGVKSSDASWASDVAALNNLAASDIAAELATYAAVKSSDAAHASDIAGLNDIVASDIWDVKSSDHTTAGTFGLYLDGQLTLIGTDVYDELVTYDVCKTTDGGGGALAASDVQAELVTYGGLKSSDGAWASDVAALNNLAASDIQAELVTYDAATGTEIAAVPTTNLDASDIAAELTTYAALKSSDGVWTSDLAALNNLAASDLNNIAATDIFDYVADGTVTFVQSVRLANSVLGGKSSGGGTTDLVFRDLGDSKDRVTAGVDSDHNRTAMTLTLT